MRPVEGSLPFIVDGVSKQNVSSRSLLAFKSCTNRHLRHATGNQKRPPSKHVATLPGTFPADAFYHSIKRDAVERYHVTIDSGNLRVFDYNGVAKGVNYGPGAQAYLSAIDEGTLQTVPPRNAFAVSTAVDYSFVTNKLKTAKLSLTKKTAGLVIDPYQSVATTIPLPPSGQYSQSLIYIRGAAYAKNYKIFINNTLVASYRTPDGTSTDANQSGLEQGATTQINIAKALFWGGVIGTGTAASNYAGDTDVPTSLGTGTNIPYGISNGWNAAVADGSRYANYSDGQCDLRLIDSLLSNQYLVYRYGSVLHILHKAGTAFTVKVECPGAGEDAHMVVVKDFVESFSSLPNSAPTGFLVKVSGEPGEVVDDYWVESFKESPEFDRVQWRETSAPGEYFSLDASTMPHILVREADGSFTFKQGTWDDRKVGDQTSSPDPSFIGSRIQDISFVRSRLVLVCEDSVVMSRPKFYFDFWRSTMLSVLDDDPIDINGGTSNVSKFEYGVVNDQTLYLLAAEGIYRLTSGDILTQSSVDLPLISQIEVDTKCRPVPSASTVIFKGRTTTWGDLREVIPPKEGDPSPLPQSITDHCEDYIPQSVDSLVMGGSSNMMIAYSSASTYPSVFVNNFYWEADNKLQNAWHQWDFNTGNAKAVFAAVFFADELHILMRYANGTVRIEKINCAAQVRTPDTPWQVRLDRSTQVQFGTGVAATQVITLPYPATAETQAVICSVGLDYTTYGLFLPVVSLTGNTITVSGVKDNMCITVGDSYLSSFELHPFYEQAERSNNIPLAVDRPIRVNRAWFNHTGSTSFVVEVTPAPDDQTYSSQFSPIDMGAGDEDAGVVLRNTGTFSVPVKAKNTRCKIVVRNDTPYTDTITSIDWKGETINRNR